MSRYHIVTIERQYGSGGSEVAEKLADKWGVPLLDHKILEMTAENLDALPERVAKLEESNTNSLLYSLIMAGQVINPNEIPLSPGEQVFQEQSRIIMSAANQGPCVIVGRAAGYILRDNPKVLRVFMYASNEDRLRRCMEHYKLSKKEAQENMRRFDRNRSEFYRSVTDHNWDDREAYGLLLNTSYLSIDACVDLIDATAQFSRTQN